jgi:tetratricopeptide (TPR) repeat protein
MKLLLVFFLAVACNPWRGYADPCTGIEAQLSSVSKELSHGNALAAEKTLGALEVLRPDCSLLVLDRARLQAAKGEEAADTTFMDYTTLKPRDVRGWAYFARFLLAQGEYQRADAAVSQARECDPGDPLAIAVQGQILAMKGDSQAGIKLLEQAVRLNPDDAEARFQLGSIHDRAKHPKEAVRYFSEAVEIAPCDARAWDYLALNLEPLGEIDRAQNAYERSLAENRPGAYFDDFVAYNYGRFLMKRNRLSASKEQLDKAVGQTPEVRAVWYERARLNLQMKNFQQARSDAEKAASLEDPQVVIADLQVYVLLEQIYTHLGEMELARKYADLSRSTPTPVQSDFDRTH